MKTKVEDLGVSDMRCDVQFRNSDLMMMTGNLIGIEEKASGGFILFLSLPGSYRKCGVNKGTPVEVQRTERSGTIHFAS